jgi:hypothetical protein
VPQLVRGVELPCPGIASGSDRTRIERQAGCGTWERRPRALWTPGASSRRSLLSSLIVVSIVFSACSRAFSASRLRLAGSRAAHVAVAYC